MSSSQESAFRQLVQRIDPGWRLRRAWPLTGGVSAQVTALEVERPGDAPLKLVARMHGTVDLASNPHIARDEHRLLEIAHAHDLVAPRPYYVDELCDEFPYPVVVTEFVEGETDFEPVDRSGYLAQMAAELARIHAVQHIAELSFLPGRGRGFGERPAVLDDSMGEGRIRDALEAIWPVAQVNPTVLLHGDYWPGNVLWQHGSLAAVIDWEDAATGDPLSDLAIARVELLFFLDDAAMHEFARLYLVATGINTNSLPYWDLCAALRYCGRLSSWSLEAEQEQRMRERHAWFVGQAIDALSSSQPSGV
jgi:aminoglycoside phosphotransferase (APT) family kinase protein